MAKLFENTNISSLVLKNRFVRSATGEGMADIEGACTQKMVDLMSVLAKGGAGLIITGHAFVTLDGRMGPWQTGAHCDAMLPGLSRVADAVHKEGAKIALQLNHSGCYSMKLLPDTDPNGASASSLETNGIPDCREMTKTEIRSTVRGFVDAAVRAKKAGFDGVQIHAAHNSLLSQFLSPIYNRRLDEYGGSIKHRIKMALEICNDIRSAVGNSYPVLFKINSNEYIEGGFGTHDMMYFAENLEKAGVDAIEMSGGTRHPLGMHPVARLGNPKGLYKEAYYTAAAKIYKREIGVPLILVGGIRSYEVANFLISEGITDYVSFCRPLIREPNLIQRWEKGSRHRSTCVSCNLCYNEGHGGEGVCCAIDKKSERVSLK